MGLAEKRALKQFAENEYPKFKKQIDDSCGFDVPMEVRWDSMAEIGEGYSDFLKDALPKVYFLPLIEAFKAICIDDFGKDALKKGLKKVQLANTGSSDISFESGLLTFNHDPVTNVEDWRDRKESIQKTLEKGL